MSIRVRLTDGTDGYNMTQILDTRGRTSFVAAYPSDQIEKIWVD